MEGSIEVSLTNKPTLAPKPRLAPKPFSLQQNASIRSIHAPKSPTSKPTREVEPAGISWRTPSSLAPNTSLPKSTSGPGPSPVNPAPKAQPKLAKVSQPKDLTSQSTPSDETPKWEQNHKEDFVNDAQNRRESVSEGSSAAPSTYHLGSVRKRLPAALTSMFESGGPLPVPKPITSNTKDTSSKPASSSPDKSNETLEPSNKERDEPELKEDYTGGNSIKRRISLLFDSSSRPEAMTKTEEPVMVNGRGDVKERIKSWATESSSDVEKEPLVVPRARTRSFERATSPVAEKKPQAATVDPPAAETSPKLSAAGQPTAHQTEAREELNNSTQTVKRRPSLRRADNGDLADGESDEHAPQRNNVQRRSVRFGTVERDDGGPPVVLGSASESSSEEEDNEKAHEDETKQEVPVSVPVYRRVSLLQRKDEEVKNEEEIMKHEEFEKRRRAEEQAQARLKLEEEIRLEKEREKERAREREELRLMEEEKQREMLKEQEEHERKREEEQARERLREEERERERLREEEMEKERQKELMYQRQREEERARQMDEKLKKDQMERERLKDEERRQERLRLDRERQSQEEEERERARQAEEKLRQEEREKGRLREEADERERARRRRLEEEERMRDRLRREEDEERMRRESERKMLQDKEEEMERNRQKQREEEIRTQVERERMEELERRKREEETEKLREIEKQKEEDMRRQNESERIKELERRIREEEMEKMRLIEKHREEEMKWKIEKERMEELERRVREEERRQIEKEREEEMERLRQIENQREVERRRQIEKEREEEMERLRQIENQRDVERRRQIEEERVEEMERLRQIEKQREVERRRQIEEEREEEMERLRQIENQREVERRRQIEEEREEEMERLRQIENQREVERRRQIEEERVEEMERLRQIEKQREEAAKRLQEEMLQKEEEEKEKESWLQDRQNTTDRIEPSLTSFDSEDVNQRAKSPYLSQPTRSPTDNNFDDFSVKKPETEVVYDDFSVKPRIRGSRNKVETPPVTHSWAADPLDREETPVPLDTRSQESKEPEWMEKSDRTIPTPTYIDIEVKPEEKKQRDKPERKRVCFTDVVEVIERHEELESQEDEEEEEGQQAQVGSYHTNVEDEDTDALIDSELDKQEVISEQPQQSESPQPVLDEAPDLSSEDPDSSDFQREPQLAPFPESATPLLDTSAQRSRVELGKRRSRSRPTRSFRAGLDQTERRDWRIRDTTDENKITQSQSDSEDEQPKSKVASSPPTQRVPVFPGVSPAALIAQLKKRTPGGSSRRREEEEADKAVEEKESQNEDVVVSPSQLARSPRSAAQLAGAARVLPPIGGKDGGTLASPAWLKELKSKKRLSQYDGEA